MKGTTTRTRVRAPTVRMKTSKRLTLTFTASGRPGWRARNGALLLKIVCLTPFALVFAGVGSAGAAAPSKADKNKAKREATAVVRIAQGQVVNGGKKPLAGAIVYLEDPTSLNIKSYLTDESGHFHFNQLAAQTDYEVWAEQNGTQSKHKFISQFSSHTHFSFQLTLDPDKKKKLLGFL